MKTITTLAIAAATLLAMPQIPGFSLEAHAGAPSTHQLKNEGKRTCRAIAHGWVGKVSGLEYGDYHDPFDRFNIRYCFKTRAQCAKFVNNIERLAYPVEVVTRRSCRAY